MAAQTGAAGTTGIPGGTPLSPGDILLVDGLADQVGRLSAQLGDLMRLRGEQKTALLAQWQGRLADQFGNTDFPRTEQRLFQVQEGLFRLELKLRAAARHTAPILPL